MLEIIDVASNVLAECKQDATLEKRREEESAPASTASKRTPFSPPSVEEVHAFIAEQGYTVSAEKFVSFYESKGWMVGKARMVSWKAAVTGWQKTDDERKAPKQRPLLSDEENARRARAAREMV